MDPNSTLDHSRIDKYLGTYNGYIAIKPKSGYAAAINWIDKVAGIEFGYSDGGGSTVVIWKDGSFLALKEAYNQGILTRNDLRDISYYLAYDNSLLYL